MTLGSEELEQRLTPSGNLPTGTMPLACGCPMCNPQAPTPADYRLGQATAPSGAAASVASAKWPQPGGAGTPVSITYSFSNLLDGGLGGGLAPSTIRAAVQEALGRWAAVAPLNFIEVADAGPAPSNNDYNAAGLPMMRFGRATIDGPYNTLAYAYYPGGTGLAGDLTFDTSERWAVSPRQGIDLIEVATHEIGHALGLGHEPAPASGGQNAIMNPVYGGRFNGPGTSFLLADDINGIRSLYGAGTGAVTSLPGYLPPITPTVAAASSVLRSYYVQVLGRAGSASEVQNWVSALQTGWTWAQVASAFVNSVEANGKVVDQYYQSYLGRTADALSRSAWARALAGGMTRQQFAESLASSSEFVNRFNTPDSYVQAVYRAVLGRTPSAAEAAAWANRVRAGTPRGQVAWAIINSTEAYSKAVNDNYVKLLGRTADTGGRTGWVGVVSAGQAQLTDVQVGILSSYEFIMRND